MTDGPWGTRDGSSTRSTLTEAPVEQRLRVASRDKGQHPLWMLASTLILGGFIWWTTGSWVVAVSALVGLFVHEYGHVLAMNALGMGPARIHIILFLGGLARAARNPVSEWHGVLVSLAGPAFGLLAMIPAVGMWFVTGDAAWMFGAFVIAMINLVNLAPAPPLDGSKALGPVLAKVHPMLEKVALILVGGLAVWWGIATGRWVLAAFLGIAVAGSLRRGAWRAGERKLDAGEAVLSFGLYLATALVCLSAAIGVLLPMADGSMDRAFDIAGRFVGLGR